MDEVDRRSLSRSPAVDREDGVSDVPAQLSYAAGPSPFWMRPVDRRMFGRLLLAMVMTVALFVMMWFALREHALRGYRSGGGGGGVPGYNLFFYARDDLTADGFRAVMYPQFLNADPVRYQYYGVQNQENRVHAKWDGRAIWYGGTKIDIPPGKDTAVIAPDGTVSFLTLAPQYLQYGPEETRSVWNGLYTARKRFPVYDDLPVIQALDAAGLLPAWTRLRENLPMSRPSSR